MVCRCGGGQSGSVSVEETLVLCAVDSLGCCCKVPDGTARGVAIAANDDAPERRAH